MPGREKEREWSFKLATRCHVRGERKGQCKGETIGDEEEEEAQPKKWCCSGLTIEDKSEEEWDSDEETDDDSEGDSDCLSGDD